LGSMGVTPANIEKYLPAVFKVVKDSVGADGKLNVIAMLRGTFALADEILASQGDGDKDASPKPADDKPEPGNSDDQQ
jgi:hypothetical protein